MNEEIKGNEKYLDTSPTEALGVALSVIPPMSGTEQTDCQSFAKGMERHLNIMGFQINRTVVSIGNSGTTYDINET